MNESKVSHIALNIIEKYQKLIGQGLIIKDDEVCLFLRMRVDFFNHLKKHLLTIEDKSERYDLLEAYKILSQISFDMLAKEVMRDN